MNMLKGRLHRLTTKFPQLIEQLPDEDLHNAWKTLQTLYCDLYMLKAIQESKQTLQPGETLTREEALRILHSP